ncbi:alginate lyase family protein [Calditrichota bacterium GD2]
MSIKTKLKKLSRVTAAELLFRLKEKWIIIREKKAYPAILDQYFDDDFNLFMNDAAQMLKPIDDGCPAQIFHAPKRRPLLAEPLSEKKKEIFKKQFNRQFKKTIERADDFLQHKFCFLGVSFQLPDPIPWQSDPVSLQPFPTGFYDEVDIFTNQNPGDIKHVWEVNRLQFLIEVAKAYYLTGDEKYRRKIDALIADWYRKNPYQTGIAWASALEVGVRALALIWTLYFYTAGKNPDAQTIKTILKILYWSGLFLNDHLSIYFSPYNHLIGETAALFAIGFLFPEFKGADRWRQKALRVLEDQVQKQFHADGGSVEQATFYHHFTLGFYLQTIALLRHNRQTVPQKMLQRVEKALEFSMHMMRPDGTFPYLGDIDDARSIYFSDPTSWDFRAYQCFGAVWFNRGDMKFMSGGLQEDAFWILSEQELKDFETLKTEKPRAKTIFLDQSGYYVFRSGFEESSHFSLMDCGPLADGVFYDETPSAAHGHADLLQIEIAPSGEPLLIDPGFSNYRGEYNWHTYFRSTAAHNTVTINGQSQARQTGILKWSFAPPFKRLSVVQHNGFSGVCGEHYGYQKLTGKPVHRRYFLFIDQTFWLAVDYLYAEENTAFDLEWNWHFNHFVQVEKLAGQTGFKASGRNSALLILPAFPANLQTAAELKKGGKNPDEGWISPTYRRRLPAPLLSYQIKTSLPLIVPTVILPEKQDARWDIRQTESDYSLRLGRQSYQIKRAERPDSDEILTVTVGNQTLYLSGREPYFRQS